MVYSYCLKGLGTVGWYGGCVGEGWGWGGVRWRVGGDRGGEREGGGCMGAWVDGGGEHVEPIAYDLIKVVLIVGFNGEMRTLPALGRWRELSAHPWFTARHGGSR